MTAQRTNNERITDLESADRAQDTKIRDLEAAGLTADKQMIALAREVDGLAGKLEHRAVIEQAKGIIMHTMNCGPDAAFAVLVAQSQSENRKLHDIATEIAAAQRRP